MTEQTLSVKLKADGSGLVGEFKLSGAEVEKFTKRLNTSGKTADSVNKNFTRAAGGVRSISDQLQIAKRQLLAFIGVSEGLRQLNNLVNLADDYKLVNSRLKLVTDSNEQFLQVQKELFQVSQNNRVSLQSTTDIYGRMARSTRELNVSQQALLTVTDTINKTLIISGGNVQSAEAALIQLGQGMASGALRGQELMSVMEQTPRLAEALAAGLGVPLGKLREMGEAGEITSEMIIRALLKQKAAVDKEFGAIPATVGQAMTILTNGFMRYIGQADEGTGATRTLAEAIIGLANNIDLLASTLFTAGKIAAGVFITRWILAAKTVAVFSTAMIALRGVIAGIIPLLQFGLVASITALASPLRFASVATTVFTRSLVASTAATWANIKAAGALKSAWSLFFAAWSGWEIGTWLRDNFLEARLAGLAFVSAMVNGWERMKFTASAVWEGIKAAGNGAMNSIREALAEYYDFVASGLEKIGATDTAANMRSFADGLRPAQDATSAFEQKLASLREEMQNNITFNNMIIDDMVDYEIQMSRTTDTTNKLTDANKAFGRSLKTLTEEQQDLLDAIYPEEKAFKDYADNLNELQRISVKLGWSQSQLDDAVYELTESYLDLGDATSTVKTNMDGMAEQIAQIYEDTASSIRSSFRDTFRDMLDGGEDAFSNFGKRLKDLFKDILADMATLAIARPVIVPIVSTIGGVFGVNNAAQTAVLNQLGGAAATDVAAAGGDVAGSFASNAAGSAVSNYFTGSMLESGLGYASTYAGSYMAGASAGQAAMLAEQTAAFGPSGAAMTTEALGGIGPSGASLGAMAGAGLLGGLYGYNYSGTKGAITGSAGAMIGMAIGGPVGAVIGGAIGGSLFGGKKQETGRGVQINLDDADSVSGQSYTDYKKKKKLFGGTKRWREYGDLDEEVRDSVAGVFANITMAVNDFSSMLETDFNSRIDAYQANFEGTMEELADWMDEVSMDMLATALPGLDTFRRAGETVDQVFSRLNQTIALMEGLGESLSAQIRMMKGETTSFDEADSDIQRLWDRLANTDDIQNRVTLENQLYQMIMNRYQAEMSMLTQVVSAIDSTLGNYALQQMTPAQQLSVFGNEFMSLMNQSSGLQGAELAIVAQQLNDLASPLLTVARDVYASGAGYQSIYDFVTGGLVDVRNQLAGDATSLQQATIDELEQIRALLAVDQQTLTGTPMGSHADGLSWVPHDNYVANLHRGEAVIDANSMQALRKYGIGDSGATVSLLQKLIAAVEKGSDLVIKVVTPDGRMLKEETIRDIRDRSAKGETIVYASGVAS